MNNKELKTISELGEFGLINHLTKNIELKNSSSKHGIGDDAAVINYKNKNSVISTDLLIEGIHFDMVFTPLKHLGYKAIAVNISDIIAMNAKPQQVTVSLGISSKYSLDAMEEIYSGMKLACEKYGVDIIGGDTSSSVSGLIISITAIGSAENNDLVYRSGAKENDLIVVSGDLGAAFVGLTLLQREKEVFNNNPKMQPNLEGNDYILQRQLKPEARVDIIKLLKEINVKATSMIDISDGLASDLLHICENSKVACQIYEEKIPIDKNTYNTAMEFNLNPSTCALNGGEDYELLFTTDISNYDKIKDNINLSIIGHITKQDQGKILITKGGTSSELKAQGWEHLNS